MKQTRNTSKMLPKLSMSFATIFFFLLLAASSSTNASDADPLQDFCVAAPTNGTHHNHHLHFLPCKNTTVEADDFVFSGIKSPGDFSDMGFAGFLATANSFPGLNTLGMSISRADLWPEGVNAPHFHPRATELAYVVKGKIYAGFVDSTNKVYAKVIEKGEVMVFPRGLVHFQMNVGKSLATIIGCFNSQNPGVQRVANSLFGGEIRDEVLQKAFGLSGKEIGSIRKKFQPKTEK